MRIVVWNCRMALAKKRDLLYQFRPDIAVIPECSRDSMQACKQDGYNTCWWGENRQKGLGLLAAKPWSLDAGCKPTQRWIAAARVHGPRDFLLLSVWACPVGSQKEKNYVGQIYEAIVRHPKWFSGNFPTVICGDFNSNSIFDPARKKRTHSKIVQLLAARGLISAYHHFFSEDHGKETRPTHYLLFQKHRPFHLDYIFLPKTWRITDCQVGTYDAWRPASDHVPVLVDIAEEQSSHTLQISSAVGA